MEGPGVVVVVVVVVDVGVAVFSSGPNGLKPPSSSPSSSRRWYMFCFVSFRSVSFSCDKQRFDFGTRGGKYERGRDKEDDKESK